MTEVQKNSCIKSGFLGIATDRLLCLHNSGEFVDIHGEVDNFEKNFTHV